MTDVHNEHVLGIFDNYCVYLAHRCFSNLDLLYVDSKVLEYMLSI